MKVTASTSAALTAVSYRVASASAVASSSRVPLRALHSSPLRSREGGDGRASPAAPRSGLRLIADIVKRRSAENKESREASGSNSVSNAFGTGPDSYDVVTPPPDDRDPRAKSPNAALASKAAAAGLKRSIVRHPVQGQQYVPNTFNYDSLTRLPQRRMVIPNPPTKKQAMRTDQIYQLGLNPAKPSLHDDSYKNRNFLLPFISEMGRIRPRAETRLTRGSQRKMGKAIRRARAMGLIPTMSAPMEH